MTMSRVRRTLLGLILGVLCPSACATTFIVTSGNSSGPGTLSEAIMLANANPGADTISFAVGSGPVIISLASPLPVITGATTIDASTQPGYATTPVITIDANGFTDCIQFANSAAEGTSQVIALSLKGAVLAGIQSATPLRVIRSLIGETGAKRNGNGIYLTAGGSSTTIDKNVIGGNEIGIIVQAGVDGLTITGNMIGVESDGVTPRRNTIAGIEVIGAKNILIGGTTVAARNVISGNGDGGGVAGDGILVTTADHLTIAGNYVGLAASGAAPVLPPQAFGIVVSDTTNSVIGGTDPAARNVVSGNTIGGIAVVGSSDHVEVLNNFVGVDAAGALAIPSGTGITAGGSNIVVGRTGSGNVVAGGTVTFFSTGNGVTSAIRGSGLIQANLIGLDATGLNILHNGGAGIETRLSADLLIDGNTIAGSGSDGIRLSGSAPSFLSTGIVIQRNRIGTNVSGGPAPNAGSGIHIASDATGNTIGMTNSASQANTIMFNGGAGVVVEGNATGNAIRANGIDQNGALGIDLGADGVTER